MPTYQEKLRDKRWQLKKTEILTRDNFKCQNPSCKSNENASVEVHHLDYIPDIAPWEYPNDMLVTLCNPCHQKEQERPKEEKYLINTLKMKGFLIGDLFAFSSKMETDINFTKSLLNILRDFQK